MALPRLGRSWTIKSSSGSRDWLRLKDVLGTGQVRWLFERIRAGVWLACIQANHSGIEFSRCLPRLGSERFHGDSSGLEGVCVKRKSHIVWRLAEYPIMIPFYRVSEEMRRSRDVT